ETRLFKPKESYRTSGGGGFGGGPTATLGQNPANGVVVYYSLKAKPTADMTLEFLDLAGKSIRKFTARAQRPAEGATSTPAPPAGEGGGFGGGAPPPLPTNVGLNRFVWDMRHTDA